MMRTRRQRGPVSIVALLVALLMPAPAASLPSAAADADAGRSAAGAIATATATALPISIEAAPPPRQTFRGFGWSLIRGGGSPFHGPLGNFSSAVREELLTLLCEGLGTTVVRLWWTPSEDTHPALSGDAEFMAAYVESGLVRDLRRHGVRQLLLAPDDPCAPNAQNSTAGGHSIALRATQTAGFIRALRERGAVIDVTGVANEPGCWAKWQNSSGGTSDAGWPRVPDTSGNFVGAVKQLSQALAAEGIAPGSVKIIGPESSNADSHGFAEVMACRADPGCWPALDAVASHSYGMAANEQWENATRPGLRNQGKRLLLHPATPYYPFPRGKIHAMGNI